MPLAARIADLPVLAGWSLVFLANNEALVLSLRCGASRRGKQGLVEKSKIAEVGDRIVSVNGTDCSGKTQDALMKLLVARPVTIVFGRSREILRQPTHTGPGHCHATRDTGDGRARALSHCGGG